MTNLVQQVSTDPYNLERVYVLWFLANTNIPSVSGEETVFDAVVPRLR